MNAAARALRDHNETPCRDCGHDRLAHVDGRCGPCREQPGGARCRGYRADERAAAWLRTQRTARGA